MQNDQIVRAWRDRRYRETLTPEQLASMPENPAGIVSLDDTDLGDVAGADGTYYIPILSWGCCGGLTAADACPSGCAACGSIRPSEVIK